MKENKKVIWSSDIDIDDWEDFFEEEYPDEELSDIEKYELASEMNDMYFDDEKCNLDIPTDFTIVAIGDLGFWYGRRTGALELGNNINKIMRFFVDGMSDLELYFDGKDIKGRETHHDGTNHYTYRIMKKGKSFDTMMEKELTHDRILRYTTSIAPFVKKVYGW